MQILQPGELFARYRVKSVLGEGGFAVVYRAVEQASDRLVALKVLQPDSEPGYSPRTRARFEREVGILAQLRSPRTVSMLAHGETEGLLWVAFEHLPGIDLVELLEARGRLESRVVVAILLQLLDSLDEAHRLGLFHRDIKPHNVRVLGGEGEDIEVKLLDFGIARSDDDSHPSMTRTGELVGTPRYMSPEQLTQRPLTARSDIYSLGLMAFELVVGRDALPGSRLPDQLQRLLSGHVFTTDQIERVGPKFLRVLQKMTALEPEDRFATVSQVREALSGVQGSREVATDRRTLALPSPRTRRRARPAVLALLLVVVAGAALWLLTSRRNTPSSVSAPVAARSHVPLIVRAPDSGVPPTARDMSADLTAFDAQQQPPDGGLTAVPSIGCGRSAPAFAPHDALAYIPKTTAPRPLLIVLHPSSVGARAYLATTKFVELASKHDIVLAAPEAGGSKWLPLDRDRLEELFEVVSSQLCIDTSRVFLVATGGGGRVVRDLECAPWIKAVGYYGFMPNGGLARCQKPHPTISVAPTQSEYVRIDGGPGCANRAPTATLDGFEKLQRQQNGIRGNGTEVVDDYGTCTRWEGEEPFVSCRVDGGIDWFPPLLFQAFCSDEPGPSPFKVEERIWTFFDTLSPK